MQIADGRRTGGMYELRDAGKLTGVPRGQVRAWFGSAGAAGPPSLLGGVQSGPMGHEMISFLQLVELDVAGMLVRNGASPDIVRQIRDYASDRLDAENPLARIEMRTIARHAAQGGGHDAGDAPPAAPLALIEAYAGERCDYGDDWATKFHPLGRESQLEIDPRYRGGQLCAAGTSLIAIALAWGAASGEPLGKVADEYGVPRRAVEEAVAWFCDDLEQ